MKLHVIFFLKYAKLLSVAVAVNATSSRGVNVNSNRTTRAHTRTYLHKYVWMCVFVCVCEWVCNRIVSMCVWWDSLKGASCRQSDKSGLRLLTRLLLLLLMLLSDWCLAGVSFLFVCLSSLFDVVRPFQFRFHYENSWLAEIEIEIDKFNSRIQILSSPLPLYPRCRVPWWIANIDSIPTAAAQRQNSRAEAKHH